MCFMLFDSSFESCRGMLVREEGSDFLVSARSLQIPCTEIIEITYRTSECGHSDDSSTGLSGPDSLLVLLDRGAAVCTKVAHRAGLVEHVAVPRGRRIYEGLARRLKFRRSQEVGLTGCHSLSFIL